MPNRSRVFLSLPLGAALLLGCQPGAAPESKTSAVTPVASGGRTAAPADRPHHGPPPEAVTACRGLAADAACSFALGEETVTGKCRPGPQADLPAACFPDHPMGPPPGRHHGPPAEAVVACQDLAADAACSFTLGAETIAGTCGSCPLGGGALACRPDRPMGPHRGRHHGPPPEAVTACASLAADAACTVKLGERSITGTCRPGPIADRPLACRPDWPMGRHHGPPPEAVTACASLAADAACTVKLGERTILGTCRKGPRPDLPTACIPAGPPR